MTMRFESFCGWVWHLDEAGALRRISELVLEGNDHLEAGPGDLLRG